ncbi:uncharacterized protein ARMOST_09148 [Armillaria ostoyae]|uniref:Transcription factor tau subunit sfc3/Tfc3 C-terminal domain-containing protein n=1 Tax=Armillaria ostoyae TaxID=47428 RepID=A0A284RAP6_ARMOS|nr:uncharacterized protein ARMOST_09148 [Armillaria ostoyae]
MDELLHHCLRELSFDGDLGSNPSRLRDFIVDFYSHNSSSAAQNTDDSFCAFVWSLVVQQPNVLVGTKPTGVNSEVWIAPQTSAKRKASAKGESLVETRPAQLETITDAKSRSLEDLIKEYGDDLRIAVDPDSIYAAVTGSHIRFPKMSPMVYSALQIITRGRDNGVSVVELGQRSKYDQKTCFYLVRQLTELDLVVKVRRGGVGSHFCIHRYFFDRSPSWKAIRDEESNAAASLKPEFPPGDTEAADEDNISPEVRALNFTPIDARHLSSLPLIRARVLNLLKVSKNQIHPANNLIVTIGFKHPTKTDRRFFQSRIREMIQEGIIEKVVVPNRKKNSASSVTCFRLVEEVQSRAQGPVAVPDADDDDDNETEQGGVKTNTTIHKQIIDLLEESGTKGMTLNELSAALCHFDKRTIELLLTRAEKVQPPLHLSDLGISGLMETFGRERRHRYYTVSAYHSLVSQEKLDASSARLAEVDFGDSCGFMPMDPKSFYGDTKALIKHQDAGREELTKKSKAKKAPKKPVLSDGTVKLGRRKKSQDDEDGAPVQARASRRQTKKRKRNSKEDQEADADTASAGPSTKRRKTTRIDSGDAEGSVQAIPKKRGRPQKVRAEDKDAQTPQPARVVTRRSRKRKGDGDIHLEDQDAVADNISDVEEPPAKRPHHSTSIEPQTSELPIPDPPDQAGIAEPIVEPQDIPGGAAVLLEERADVIPVPSPSVESIDMATATTLTPHATVVAEETPQAEETLPAVSVTETTEVPIDPALLGEPMQDVQETTIETDQQLNAPKGRVNVSHLRRENEFYRVIELLGGIVNTQTKDVFDAHSSLLETLSLAGEPTSSPAGTRTDKRTATATFNSLESRGRIKQIKTSVPGPAGVSRPTVIVYLLDTPEEKLTAFLAELAKGSIPIPPQPGTARKIDDPVEYGPDPTLIAREGLPLQLLQMEDSSGHDQAERWKKNTARAEKLFTHDDKVIKEVLLAERTTLGQMYGNIVAKGLRSRELHITAMKAFENTDPSSEIASHEHRILNLSFFCYDLPLGLYCSLLSPLFHHEQLTQFVANAECRQTLVRDLPQGLQSILQIGKSRARSRFLDILEVLRHLGLAIPLTPSKSVSPWLRCETLGDHPKGYEQASLEGWTASTPTTAPTYWQFKTSAPLYHWASSELSPPFLQNVDVRTADEASKYWELLREACLNNSILPAITDGQTPLSIPTVSSRVSRSLRRSVSWNPNYVFTWHQTQYLRRFVNIDTGKTPLDLEDGGAAEIARISDIVSAPPDAVREHYATAHEKMVKDLEKMERRRKRESSETWAKEAADAKATLAKRAADARLYREHEWDDLVRKVHPEPSPYATIRLRTIQARFLQSVGKETEKWESEVEQAFREADLASAQVLKTSQAPPVHKARSRPPRVASSSVSVQSTPSTASSSAPAASSLPTPITTNPVEKSIYALIAEQGPPIIPPPRTDSKRKRKRKLEEAGAEEQPPEPKVKPLTRRHRFQWNRDYEELARDASVIIRARCRNGVRLDWGAFEQVFPAVPRNSVRQRLAHIRESPGNEAYLTRLEDRWYDLWMEHRGTATLPDDDLSSATNFNLIRHLEFLRSHIDKNALRVGYAQPQESSNAELIIPNTVDDLLDGFDVIEAATTTGPTWDFMWNGVVEEGREKRLTSQPFLDTLGNLGETPVDDALAIAESALKIALGTPLEHYDAEGASTLLRSAAEEHIVTSATKGLVSRGVLSKLVRDHHRQKPGRQLKISDANLAALGGSISSDLFQDAAGLEEDLTAGESDTWREWPLTATDGDSAALIQLVSDNKVDFKIDTTNAQAARPMLDWNSKKADDDQIETILHVQFRNMSLRSSSSQAMPIVQSMDNDCSESTGLPTSDAVHGQAVDGSAACCRRVTDNGVVDCTGCLDEQWASVSLTFSAEEMIVAHAVLSIVGQAGGQGSSRIALAESTKTSMEVLLPVIQRLVEPPLPLLYWVGYSSVYLVSAAHIKTWTVTLPSEILLNVFPRRWIDISGTKLAEVWEAALRAAIGVIVFRPGISQAELRWRLRGVYDRQEVYDILQYLLEDEIIKTSINSQMVPVLDEREEKEVFYFLNQSKKWYRL